MILNQINQLFPYNNFLAAPFNRLMYPITSFQSSIE